MLDYPAADADDCPRCGEMYRLSDGRHYCRHNEAPEPVTEDDYLYDFELAGGA